MLHTPYERTLFATNYLPLRFARTLVPYDPNITNLADTRFGKELVDFLFFSV